MPRDLFGDIQQPSVRVGTRSRYTVPLSLVAHALAIAAVAAAALMGPVVLPGLASAAIEYELVVVPPEPPPALRRARAESPPAANPDAAPVVAPDAITLEPARAADPWPADTPGTGTIVGVDSLDTIVGEPPPLPAPTPAVVRPGGEVRTPTKVHDVAPAYPAIAQAARVQGVVVIEATLAEDGRVRDARVLRSIPLLDEAALSAVRQWRYTPTRLNGVPVSVVMTVTVNFQLR